MAGLASLFFIFNTGQLTREKTKLVNTTDAVAYAAGIMHARALNFDSYANRALVANEVLIAQMVSLSSWARYVSQHIKTMPEVDAFQMCKEYIQAYYIPFHGFYQIGLKAGGEYAAACNILAEESLSIGQRIKKAADDVPALSQDVVSATEAVKAAITLGQAAMHGRLAIARNEVMKEVAEANYRGDGAIDVDVDVLPIGGLTNDWAGFTQPYRGDERTRFAEVTRLAAYGDGKNNDLGDAFVRSRSWTASQLVPTDWQCMLSWNRNQVVRRGGTELVNYDEWKAEDTLSYHYFTGRTRWGKPKCSHHEEALGWGEQQAHPEDADQDESGAWLGGAPATNPAAHSGASSVAWTNYSGLPSFYDLSADMLAKNSNLDEADAARLRFTVRLRRKTSETGTSQGRSAIRSTPQLNAYAANAAEDAATGTPVLSQIATSEVYFRRPPLQSQNSYGQTLGQPEELGSLFNPYWQVRLAQPSASDFAKAKWMQGSVGY